MTLSGPESIIGKGFIVHERRDDGVTQSTGDAGSRFAQCVIGIKKTEAQNDATSTSNTWATCELRGVSDKGIYGRVNFEQTQNGTVKVYAKVCGMKINTQHGFHVHQFGDLSGETRATNLGTHYNPTGANHGLPPNARHIGDMV
jgi:Cu/Zn superoxide dismutase